MTSTHPKLTILVDNRSGDGLTTEHGLSILIETAEQTILFDTGQGKALEPNVLALGADLARARILVLSHGHYDHTGGIPYVLDQVRDVELYCHPAVVGLRYSIRNGKPKPIHMQPESRALIDALPPQSVHWIEEPTQLAEGIYLTGPIPRETAFEDTGGPFFLDAEGKHPDPIEDDLALWMKTNDGIVVSVGCCHAGLVNTLNYIRHLSGGDKIRAVIGGFHLMNAGRERLRQTMTALRQFEPDQIIPCHCTGEPAVTVLREAFGERVSQGAAGMSYQF